MLQDDLHQRGIHPPGFKLPDVTHPGPIRLQVADLGRSVDFYRQILGFAAHAQEGVTAGLGPPDSETVLVELVERPGARPVPPRGRLGLFHVAYLLPDRPSLGRFLRHASERGVRLGMSDHLVSEAIYLSDPDGLGIEVYADRPRSAWRYDERQIVMATEPLDVRSLLSTAGDMPWRGAPQGTVVGHVHLHVGTLDEAKGFYHNALGLDQVVWNYPGALFLSAGGYHHHLGTNTWAAGAPPASEGDARLLEWSLVVPTAADAAAAARSLEASGAPVRSDGNDVLAADPWGTNLRIIASA